MRLHCLVALDIRRVKASAIDAAQIAPAIAIPNWKKSVIITPLKPPREEYETVIIDAQKMVWNGDNPNITAPILLQILSDKTAFPVIGYGGLFF